MLVQLYIVNEMCSIKSESLLIQHYLTSQPFTYDKVNNVFKFETLDLNKVLILIKNVCLKYSLPSLHIQIELDTDTILDYSSLASKHLLREVIEIKVPRYKWLRLINI